MTKDYNAKLLEDYEEIRGKVERGMLPLVARLPAIEKAVSKYVISRDEHLESKRNPPIAYRDEKALERFADLILYEELTWSHPDKISIVEYPIMSDWQEKERRDKTSYPGEVTHNDRQYNGRRKTHSIGNHGEVSVSNHRMPSFEDINIETIIDEIDVADLLESANLSDRQRQVIELLYQEDKTQEQASEILNISRATIRVNQERALNKLRKILNI